MQSDTVQINKVPPISCVMPALNEQENIEMMVRESAMAMTAVTQTFEILVIDDGSSDATPGILRKLEKELSFLRILRHEQNLGYGASLREGIAAARHPLVLWTDSDLQFDMSDITCLLRLLDGHDIVTGWRVRREDSKLRRALSIGYNNLIRLLFDLPFHDVNCAFKLFRREAIDTSWIKTNGFTAMVELFVKARGAGLGLAEVQVRHFARRAGRTTVRPIHIPITLLELVRLWLAVRTTNRLT